jgi:hypothetical protein
MRFVAIKTVAQQDLQAIHRTRSERPPADRQGRQPDTRAARRTRTDRRATHRTVKVSLANDW